MGYYSEVALIIDEKIYESVDGHVIECLDACFIKQDEKKERYPDRKGIVFLAKHTKWYDDFEEVIIVDKFISTLDHKDYAFIRIGEDFDDIEIKGAVAEWGMGITRTVKFYQGE